MKITPEDLEKIKKLPLHEQARLIKLLRAEVERQDLEAARTTMRGFTKRLWPKFIEGRHHIKMAEILDSIVAGKRKRVAINLAPRHTKSETCSWLFPSYTFGRRPDQKVIQVSNLAELAMGFGRKVRDTVNSPEFSEIFPDVSVREDSRAANRWDTNKGGTYYATGVGGTMTGRGADILVIDDPHSENEAKLAQFNPKIFKDTYEWYLAGPRQRLQPGGAILLVMTRWGKSDLQGLIMQDAIENGSISEWEVFEFPALMPSGEPLWPEYWSKKELEEVKRDLPTTRWLAQYQQTPTADEGAIIKRDWWKPWEKDRLPKIEYTIQSWDTAYTKSNSADYSACTTWGIFYEEEGSRRVPNVILLNSYRDRVEFPALKKRVMQLSKDWSPDTILIERRSSGGPLIDELRYMGLAIEEYTPSRGKGGNPNDKIARLNAVADLFKSGMVWYNPNKLNEYTIEECSDFPVGNHDDLVDTVSQAMLRMREGRLISSLNDDDRIYGDEDDEDEPRRKSWRLY